MLSPTQIIIRLTVATVLGLLVGFERGRLERAAGMRTHAMVSLGSALIIIVSAFGFADVRGIPDVVLDPSRVAAQVVSGIGFLGAGTIILRKEIVRGLTTAASVWAVAGIGLAVGGGLYLAAASSTVLALIVLAGVRPLERRMHSHQAPRTITLTISDSNLASIPVVRQSVESASLRLERILMQRGSKTDESVVQIVIGQAAPEKVAALLKVLSRIPGVIDAQASIGTSRSIKSRESASDARLAEVSSHSSKDED